MVMAELQLEKVGQSLAQMIHYSMNWEEAMNGDDIETLVNAFKKELKELNGDKYAS